MKITKNLILTLVAIVMLIGFAFFTPSPAITDEAYDVYQGLTEE